MSTSASIPPQELAAARQAVYRFVLAALDRPTAQQHDWFSSDPFANNLRQLCALFGVAAPGDSPAAADRAEHEARYLACFEVGLPEPPVPLLASHYNRREPVPATIHEHLLFYRRFGRLPAPGNRESADHLGNELAWLIHLDDWRPADGPALESLLRARRDFLKRHPARWLPRAAQQATDRGLPDVYRALLDMLAAAVGEDLALTETALAGLCGVSS